MVVDGRDYCTLVTCTPYGVNTHRLLVRGKRIDARNPTGRIPVFADARVVDPLTVAPLIAVPLLGLAALIGWIRLKKTYV